MTETRTVLTGERADLVDSLRRHREFLLIPVRGLTDEQARTRTTVSELTLGGLLKHVTATERTWADFMVDGPAPGPDFSAIDWSNPPAEVLAWREEFRFAPEETLEGLLKAYGEVAARTDELVGSLDLDAAHPLPQAPWFEPGASWTVRRTALHIIAETAQHAGHADILRETLDGQKSMG